MEEPSPLANEGWFNNRWRPAMAWLWFSVSAFDFILFPILNALAAGMKLIPYQPWQPLSLQGGGLFHFAMGGVVGVSVWTRTEEKKAIYAAAAVAPTTTTMTETKVTPTTTETKTTEIASSRKD
jgi:hypothetical protein